MTETCNAHPETPLVRFCPKCRASKGGSSTSAAKREAAVANGRLGGKPRKRKKGRAR